MGFFIDINWKVGEWLKPADCKSVLFEYGGSNPSLPTQVVSGLLVIKIHRVIHEKNQFWSIRLVVRTLGFQPKNRGSIPLWTANIAGERVEARSVKPLLVGSIPTNGTKILI